MSKKLDTIAQVIHEIVDGIKDYGWPWKWDWEEVFNDSVATATGHVLAFKGPIGDCANDCNKCGGWLY
jgi:hypothetical protein